MANDGEVVANEGTKLGRPITIVDITGIAERETAARKVVHALSLNRDNWHSSIPVQPDDSDQVLTAALDDNIELAHQVLILSSWQEKMLANHRMNLEELQNLRIFALNELGGIAEFAKTFDARQDRENLIEIARTALDQLRDSIIEVSSPALTIDHLRRKVRWLEQNSADPRTRYGYALCYRCGRGLGMDADVSNEVWQQISPTGDEGGMLCVWCMDELLVEKGFVGPVAVRLAYVGQVLAMKHDQEVAPESGGTTADSRVLTVQLQLARLQIDTLLELLAHDRHEYICNESGRCSCADDEELLTAKETLRVLSNLPSLHPDDLAVLRLATAMIAKLKRKRDQGWAGWDSDELGMSERLAMMLLGQIAKGDPVDVWNFWAMLHSRADGIETLKRVTADMLAHAKWVDQKGPFFSKLRWLADQQESVNQIHELLRQNSTDPTPRPDVPDWAKFQASITDHPIIQRSNGKWIYEPKPLVAWLGAEVDMDDMARAWRNGVFSTEELMQFHRDIGYSLLRFQDVWHVELATLEAQAKAEV